MYHNKVIREKITLANSPVLIGSTSEPEQIIIGGIQEIEGLTAFKIEHSIDCNDKDSPRIDFILQVNGKYIAIEVNGFQHFYKYGFYKDEAEYNYQWIRYIKKINWCKKYKVPLIHINVLNDTRSCTKSFRKALCDFVDNGTFQSLIIASLKNNLDVSVNITKSGYVTYDYVKGTDVDDYVNKIIKGTVLGQDSKKSICQTIII